MPLRIRYEVGNEHADADGDQQHGDIGVCRGDVVFGLAVLESADDGGNAEDAVDVEHDGGEHRVACQRWIRRALQQHDQNHHFHRYGGEREDQRAIGFAQAHRQHFGVMGDAEGDADDGGKDD